ncbi:MAG: hypothetical protein ABEJ98_00960 [Candidatus Nanohaloarchaea archaeon]
MRGLSAGDVDRILEDSGIGEQEFSRINDTLGFSARDSFDSARSAELGQEVNQGSVSDTRATTRVVEGEVELLYSSDLRPAELAHEAVHGQMLQPNARMDGIPSDNPINQRLYGEFVARLAEGMVEPLETGNEELHALYRAKQRYLSEREKYAGEELDEELESLYRDFQQMGAVAREESRELHERFDRYRSAREEILAKDAAEQYLEENDVELSEYMNPSYSTYSNALEFIKNSEETILRRIE